MGLSRFRFLSEEINLVYLHALNKQIITIRWMNKKFIIKIYSLNWENGLKKIWKIVFFFYTMKKKCKLIFKYLNLFITDEFYC